MYLVTCDGITIYDPHRPDLVLTEAKLELELNSAGTFTFTMPASHPYYDTPVKMLSRVEVDRNGELLFCGRIIEESTNFYNQKTLTCEGELAFLNDSIQRPAEYHDMTVRGYLQALIESHNDQVEEDKQFTVGIVTVTDSNDSLFRYTNYSSTMEEIKDDLIDDLGGYLRVRHQDGIRYLDYVELIDYGETNDSAISFGKNLLDFTKDMDVTDIATVIIPLGERLEESEIAALDERLTIADVNGGLDWIQSDSAVETYGRIVKTVTWDDVALPENLLSKGQRYLSDTQWDSVQLTASAVDMNLTDEDVLAFHLGDQLRVTSEPHGLDRYFPLSKMSLNFLQPENNSYTLGLTTSASLLSQLITQNELSNQLGSVSARASSAMDSKIQTSMDEVLQEAKDNATILINAATASGHVVIEAPYNEILIMDTEDKETAQRAWRWNLNGLGYSKTGYAGEYGLAMTMDGAIVADYITAGDLNAIVITTGILKDKKGTNYWDLDTGEFHIASVSTLENSVNSLDDEVDTLTNSYGTLSNTVSNLSGELSSEVTAWNERATKYGICSTSAETAAKAVTCSDFTSGSLVSGVTICVYFTYANTASSPTLNVADTGSKSIYANGAVITSDSYWTAGSYAVFVYDGTHWCLADAAASSRITQLADSISLSVTGSGGTASIVLNANGSTAGSATVVTEARTAFQNETSNCTISAGTVTIEGNHLVINASNLSLSASGVLECSGATVSGKLTAINGNYESDLAPGYLAVYYNDSLYGRLIPIYANEEPNYFSLLGDSSNCGAVSIGFDNIGYIFVNNGANPNGYSERVQLAGRTRITGNLYLGSGSTYLNYLDSGGVYCSGTLSASGSVLVGNTNYGTSYVLHVAGAAYASGGWAGTSDATLKSNIQPLAADAETFLDKLEPISFTFKDDKEGKTHFGVTYQNVCDALEAEGIDPSTSGVVGTALDENGEEKGALYYDELIAPLIYEVKALKAEAQDLRYELEILKKGA